MSTHYTEEEAIAWEHSLPRKTASACLVLRHGDTVLMVKASYKPHWSFPGGIIEENEAPLAAALRETFEETGVSIAPEVCRPLGVIYVGPYQGHVDRFSFAFIADVDDPHLTLSVPNDEIDEARWAAIADIPALTHHIPHYEQIYQALETGAPNSYYAEHL